MFKSLSGLRGNDNSLQSLSYKGTEFEKQLVLVKIKCSEVPSLSYFPHPFFKARGISPSPSVYLGLDMRYWFLLVGLSLLIASSSLCFHAFPPLPLKRFFLK